MEFQQRFLNKDLPSPTNVHESDEQDIPHLIQSLAAGRPGILQRLKSDKNVKIIKLPYLSRFRHTELAQLYGPGSE